MTFRKTFKTIFPFNFQLVKVEIHTYVHYKKQMGWTISFLTFTLLWLLRWMCKFLYPPTLALVGHTPGYLQEHGDQVDLDREEEGTTLIFSSLFCPSSAEILK